MRAILGLGVAAFFGLVGGTVQAEPEPDVTLARVQAALPELEKRAERALKETGVPGMAIVIVYKDKIVYLKGFGVREAGKAEPVTPDTVFQLASLSKPISATVIAGLVSDKIVSWDDPVLRHYPDFQMFDPWVTREVTLRDMFSHRSGLPGSAGNDLEQVGFDRPDILPRLRYLKPASSFRSAYAYSNFGMTVGGVAAARAAGKEWEDVAKTRLFAPLGMTATSARYADFVAATNKAHLHVLVNGKWTPQFTRNADAQAPAGGVSSTARDLGEWVRLQLGEGMWNGNRILSKEALDQIHAPQIVSGANPATRKFGYYGLGWTVDYDAQGRLFYGHAGAFSFGARTVVKLLPSEQLGIVVLTNAFPTGLPEGMTDFFFDQVLAGKQTRDWVKLWNDGYAQFETTMAATGAAYAKPLASPLPSLGLDAYTGVYANNYFGNIEIRAEGSALTLSFGPKKQTFPLKHWNRDTFTFAPDDELPHVLRGAVFTIGPDQKAQQITLEAFNDNEQGTLQRVPAK